MCWKIFKNWLFNNEKYALFKSQKPSLAYAYGLQKFQLDCYATHLFATLINAKYSRCEYFEVSFSGSLKLLISVADSSNKNQENYLNFCLNVVNFVFQAAWKHFCIAVFRACGDYYAVALLRLVMTVIFLYGVSVLFFRLPETLKIPQISHKKQ